MIEIIRILVTGTRGKSSLVRLIHAGLIASGLRAYGRITGVLPRSLEPSGVRVIRRDSPVNFREMLWWLKSLPEDAEAIVMENSAVNPEYQPAAAKWLKPSLIVITNTRPDHIDAWGCDAHSAERAIMSGVPKNVPVVRGIDTQDYRQGNISLAFEALSFSGVHVSREVLEAVEPDIADFRLIGEGEDITACAFSANDTVSTEMLFASTGWESEDTLLLYHHRQDRPARLEDFSRWIYARKWREVIFTGGRYLVMRDFDSWRKGKGKIFACGNVAGWPLEYMICRR